MSAGGSASPRRLGQWLSALALASLLLGRARLAHADAASEAELQFELGTELYKQGKYVEAIDRFVASNRLVANPNVVLNVAQTFAYLKRASDAYNWYSTYLSFDLPADKRALGEAAQGKLASDVAVLDVSTDPSLAELVVDRLELGSVGRSPRKIAVEPGKHRVIAQLPNYHDAELAVDATRGHTEPMKLALRPITGSLVVQSTPPGASVRLEEGGRVLGQTPLQLELPVAELRLVVTLPGYVDQTRAVTIADAHEARVEIKFARAAATVSVLSVRGNVAGADVFLDHARVGAAPLTLPDLPPGPRQIDISAAGHEPWGATALFEPGAATRVDFTLVDPRDRPWGGWPWLGFGAGGALLAGGAVTGLLALSAHDDFDRDPTRARSDRVHHLNTTADILFVSGAVVALGTLIYELATPRAAHSRASVTINR